ncbi:MAG: hypothetical protein ACSLE1_00095 [Sphingobium sp.]
MNAAALFDATPIGQVGADHWRERFDVNIIGLALIPAATPSGIVAKPGDIVGPALFLASPGSSHMVGQTTNVDGGITLN